MILPREHDTPFNKAPLIRAVTALLMVMSILSAITRLATRMLTKGNLELDDMLVGASTGADGLGKLQGLTADQVSSILKAQYASDILFTATLFLSKASTTRTIWGMAPRKRRALIWATEGLYALWIYVDALNIVTDFAITSILADMFIRLKTSIAKKMLVIGVFGCRTLIIPPIICHMYYYKTATDSNNPMFDMWTPTIMTQIVLCMSVMATCVPYVKPVLDSLESGQMVAGNLGGTRTGSATTSGRALAAAHAGCPGDKSSRGITPVVTVVPDAYRRQDYKLMDMDKVGSKATVMTASEPIGLWDRQSHTSQTVLVE
ncbi:hypothetical protein CEP51_015218 [Fusarium floridanum]|uniref:Rhodopsin domain-containing protein n=1 Tax=Fusarium floridanum TaxID=1325733 RepID=A0A428PED2_9HYPO|nr:hypothetical protein CEP51_015218 [Fusarium floridanum]